MRETERVSKIDRLREKKKRKSERVKRERETGSLLTSTSLQVMFILEHLK
jgi:hypothetical protein